jgi:hypothetical protein
MLIIKSGIREGKLLKRKSFRDSSGSGQDTVGYYLKNNSENNHQPTLCAQQDYLSRIWVKQ